MPSSPVPPAPPLQRAPLRRSSDSRVIFGVCGGLAAYFGVDAVILRVALVVIGLLSGGTVIPLYCLSIFIIPKAQRPTPGIEGAETTWGPGSSLASQPTREVSHSSLGAAVLIGLGLVALIGKAGINVDGDLLWPLAFIGFGVAVLWSRRKPPKASALAEPVPADNEPHAFSTLVDNHIVKRAYERVPSATPIAKQSRGSTTTVYARVSRALVFVFVGALWLTRRVLPFALSVRTLLAVALIAIGIATLLGTWLGRPKLLTLGVVLALFLAATSALGIRFRGPVGDRTVALTTPASFGQHHVEIGTITLDATGIPSELQGLPIAADASLGEIDVLVPANVDINLTTDIGLGALTIDGKSTDVHNKRTTQLLTSTGQSAGTLALDLKVQVGEIVIQRIAATRSSSADRGPTKATPTTATPTTATPTTSVGPR